MDKLNRPIIFNIVTIAALLLCLAQTLTAPARMMSATTEASQLILEHAPESEAMAETLRLRLATERFNISMSITALIAILANVIANHLGRGRERVNQNRIRQLEAELHGLRSRRS